MQIHLRTTIFALLALVIVRAPHPQATELKPRQPFLIGLDDIPKHLEPAHVSTLIEWTLLYNLSDRLVDGGPEGLTRPGLATSWLVDTKNDSITFNLAPGRKFSDGSPITAADVIASFAYQYRSGGGTKFILRHNILSCDGPFKACPGITRDGEYTVSFHFQPHKTPDISIFAMPDFGIYPEKSLKNKDVKSMFSVTSGPFYISRYQTNMISLLPNPYYNAGLAPIDVVKIGNTSPENWIRIEPNRRIVRIPDWGRKPLNSKIYPMTSSAISAPFWVRLGFIPQFSKLTKKERGVAKEILAEMVIAATGVDIENDQPLFFRCNTSQVQQPAILRKQIIIIVNTFSFTKVEVAKLKVLMKRHFPLARIDFIRSTGRFMAAIARRKFDLAIAQNTFGLYDPLPSFQFIARGFLFNKITKNIDTDLTALRGPSNRAYRLSQFHKIANELQKQSIIFGLGSANAMFLFPKKMKVDTDELLTGEFDFRVFARAGYR